MAHLPVEPRFVSKGFLPSAALHPDLKCQLLREALSQGCFHCLAKEPRTAEESMLLLRPCTSFELHVTGWTGRLRGSKRTRCRSSRVPTPERKISAVGWQRLEGTQMLLQEECLHCRAASNAVLSGDATRRTT